MLEENGAIFPHAGSRTRAHSGAGRDRVMHSDAERFDVVAFSFCRCLAFSKEKGRFGREEWRRDLNELELELELEPSFFLS